MNSISIVEIRDHALWVKHIHGNNKLKEKIINMDAGGIIQLEIDGFQGMWVKMDDGKDGRPTQGIKPVGPAKTFWHKLQTRRGEIASICEV